jgi:hypothetical protein
MPEIEIEMPEIEIHCNLGFRIGFYRLHNLSSLQTSSPRGYSLSSFKNLQQNRISLLDTTEV